MNPKVENLEKGDYQNNKLKDIKSYHILQKIFDILTTKKSLNIMKFNKYIKNKLNVTLDNYKKYCEINLSIEIKEIPDYKNKINFININDKNEEKYFHIYFDDNKEEIKRTYTNKEDKVSKINIIIDYQVKSLYKLFYFCDCIESIFFKKFYRKNIYDMSFMFFGCTSLKKINIFNVKTNNVTDMECMFKGCSSLKKLDLSNFNTNKVSNMNSIFRGCSSLKELNISNFNTNNVINMRGMFYGCSSLTLWLRQVQGPPHLNIDM
jgi:surface protein